MLDADTDAAAYWKRSGEDALAYGVKGLIVMVSSVQAPWSKMLTDIRVPTGTAVVTRSKLQQIPNPGNSQVPMYHHPNTRTGSPSQI